MTYTRCRRSLRQERADQGLPLFTLTLQHLSFLDYSAHSAVLQRQEWAKVQGRFEDVTFVPDPSDAVQLIRRSITHEDLARIRPRACAPPRGRLRCGVVAARAARRAAC